MKTTVHIPTNEKKIAFWWHIQTPTKVLFSTIFTIDWLTFNVTLGTNSA